MEVSSLGCWDECFLPWLPDFMVNNDPPSMTVPTELLGPQVTTGSYSLVWSVPAATEAGC